MIIQSLLRFLPSVSNKYGYECGGVHFRTAFGLGFRLKTRSHRVCQSYSGVGRMDRMMSNHPLQKVPSIGGVISNSVIAQLLLDVLNQNVTVLGILLDVLEDQ